MRALDHESTEFQRVLYQLQRMMGLSKAIPSLRVWDISAQALTSRFNARVEEAGSATENQVLECSAYKLLGPMAPTSETIKNPLGPLAPTSETIKTLCGLCGANFRNY